MALVYQAHIRPSKIELIGNWAPTQPWFEGDGAAEFTTVAAYRFDDPAGEVGIETLLVRVGDGPLLQVPLTYRGAPLDGADACLITTMEHSVLGNRWVYDGAGDPAYLAAVATAALTGGHQADVMVDDENGTLTRREPTILIEGSGSETVTVAPPALDAVSLRHWQGATTVDAGDLTVSIIRVLGETTVADSSVATVADHTVADHTVADHTIAEPAPVEPAPTPPTKRAVLRGSWPHQPEQRLLVSVVLSSTP